MEKKNPEPPKLFALRRKAERMVNRKTKDLKELSSKDTESLIHELQVHQIELEMQNEELLRTQQEFENSRKRYLDLYDFAPVGYFTLNRNGIILNVNLTGAEKLGVERLFLVKKSFSLYVAPESKDIFYLHLREVFKIRTQQTDEFTCELKLINKKGFQFDALVKSQPAKDSNGNPFQCRTIVTDITSLKKVEKAVDEKSKILDAFFKYTITPLVILDKDFNFIQVNEAYAKAFQRDASKFQGHNYFEFYPSDTKDIFEQVVATKTPYQAVEKPFIFTDHPEWGMTYWDWTLVPLLDKRGMVEFLVFSLNDVTRSIEAEKHTNDINTILRLFVQASSRKEYLDEIVDLISKWSGCRCVGIRIINEHGEIPYESYIGFSQEFWEAENWLSVKRDQCACIRVILGKQEPLDVSALTQAGSFYCGNMFEFSDRLSVGEKTRFRGKCAESGFATVVLIPLRYRNEIVGLIHLADENKGRVAMNVVEFIESVSPVIGEAVKRFSLEDALKKSHDELEITVEKRTAALINTIDELHVVMAERQKIEEEVRREKEFSEILINSSVDGILAFDRNCCYTLWNPATEYITGFSKAEVIGKCAFDVFPFLKEIGEDKYFLATLEGKTVIGKERQYRGPNTSKYIWVQGYYSPLYNDLKELTGGLVIVRDITERKNAEEEIKKINEKLEFRTLELETVNKELESFCSSISHDLKSPLLAVDAYCQLLLKEYADKSQEEVKEFISYIHISTRRMFQMVDALLKLSHVTYVDMKLKKVNLSELAKEISKELQKTQLERKVEFIIMPNLILNGDARLLRIALENLLSNAWKFTGRNKKSRIEVGVTEHEGKNVYYVRDDGAGFDIAYADKLFAPFQRLHSMSDFSGNGIGLATVQRIINRHGGRIWAEAEVGKGATFYFMI